MSLILDALNRSRQDSEQIPGLASDHFVDAPVPTSSWMLWLLVGGLALAVLAIGLLLLDRLPQSAPRAPVAAEPVAAPAPALVPAPAETVATPVVAPSPRVEPTTPVAAVQAPVSTRERQRLDIPAPSRPVAAPVDPSVAALYQQRDRAAPVPAGPESRPAAAAKQPAAGSRQPAVEEVVDVELLVQAAEEELANASLPEHEVPLLSALSQQTKDAIPTLMYLRHDYSGNPAASSVVINGKTLKAGESVTGVKVLEILPDSVVLESRGDRFRLRALNSWVNL